MNNKVALVIGAGVEGNIGYASADKFYEEDYIVVVADLKFNHELFDQQTVDVTNEKQVAGLISYIKEEYGKLDVIVNSSGVNILGPIENYKLEDFNKTIAVNLTSNYLLLQAYVNEFGTDGISKKFIAITSDTAMIPKSSTFAYGASKAGANQFLRCVARELNKYHKDEWLITGLAVGRVMTPMDTKTIEDVAEQRGISEEEAEDMLSANIPVGRGATPEEVADWVNFLATKGGFASGNIIRVDGGQVQG